MSEKTNEQVIIDLESEIQRLKNELESKKVSIQSLREKVIRLEGERDAFMNVIEEMVRSLKS